MRRNRGPLLDNAATRISMAWGWDNRIHVAGDIGRLHANRYGETEMKPFDWLYLALCFAAFVAGLVYIIREEGP